MIVVIDEALLRGIDLAALEEERFTSRTHLRMVAEHELKARWLRIVAAEVARPEPVKRKVAPKTKPQGKVETAKQYLFNSEQIRIAEAIFRKEKNNE